MSERKKTIKFFKYQGAGNDFIIVDGREFPLENPLKYSKQLCKRHFSVGADDLLYLESSDVADVKMRVCEPDGSEATMCGNGIRCVAAYLRKKHGKDAFEIETLAGILKVNFDNGLYRVQMTDMQPLGRFVNPPEESFKKEIELFNKKYVIVSPGEPHAVSIVDSIYGIDINSALKVARNFSIFPKGINVDYVEIERDFIKVRTFERGVWAETLACGTGAVSSAFVAREYLKKDRILVRMRGGDLYVSFVDGKMFLSGKAELVYNGELEIGGER